MAEPVHEHEFGNVSTDLKLSMVAGYLKAFTTALQNRPSPRRPFQLLYIDAFAGTGERTVKLAAQEANLLEPSAEARTEARRGSARMAIDTSPPFDRLVFMDCKPRHVQALKDLAASFPDRKIDVVHGDANARLQGAAKRGNWKNTRAVMFLDPYGMEVDWTTLEAIRQTEAIDVWYLVSLVGLYRQATRKLSKLDNEKRSALTRMLGTRDWETAWYSESVQPSLLGMDAADADRTPDLGKLEGFVTERLRTLFPLVLPPKRLYNDRGAPMFSLYFLCSNPSQKARQVAGRIAGHILAGKSSHVRPK